MNPEQANVMPGGPEDPRPSRWIRVRQLMDNMGIDALLLSHGADLPWLSGYEAMPLERLTMMVLPADGDATLVVPALEAPRVVSDAGLFDIRPWREDEDPVEIVAALLSSGRPMKLAISDRTWADALLALQRRIPSASWSLASRVTGPLRAVKDAQEIETLAAAAEAADRVAACLMGGEISLIGRSEAEVSAEIADRLLSEGHSRVNFAIVASGPNSASPHHEPGRRRIAPGDPVVCDFGGTFPSVSGVGPGYCSDITRTVVTGKPPGQFAEVYEVVRVAQERGVSAACVGTTCEGADRASREVIEEAGYGKAFFHRTGHGIGIEEHEAPYLVAGNQDPLAEGNAFSVEPGVYLDGAFGIRIEDIVVTEAQGPRRLNSADHRLAIVDH